MKFVLAILCLGLLVASAWSAPPQSTLSKAPLQSTLDTSDPFATAQARGPECSCSETGRCSCGASCSCPPGAYLWTDCSTAGDRVLTRNGKSLGVWSKLTQRFYPTGSGESIACDDIENLWFDSSTGRVTKKQAAPVIQPFRQVAYYQPASYDFSGGNCRGGG